MTAAYLHHRQARKNPHAEVVKEAFLLLITALDKTRKARKTKKDKK